jgi:hypothetical protein
MKDKIKITREMLRRAGDSLNFFARKYGNKVYPELGDKLSRSIYFQYYTERVGYISRKLMNNLNEKKVEIGIIAGIFTLLGAIGYTYIFEYPKAEVERKERERETQIENDLMSQCQTKAAGLDGVLSEEESRIMAAQFGASVSWKEKVEIGRRWGLGEDGKPALIFYTGIKNQEGQEISYKKIPITKEQMLEYLRK